MNAVSRLTAKELNLAARTVFAEAATEGAAEAPAVAEDREAELNAMTVKDLKQYASEKGIALDSKAKKAEIIETILQAESK